MTLLTAINEGVITDEQVISQLLEGDLDDEDDTPMVRTYTVRLGDGTEAERHEVLDSQGRRRGPEFTDPKEARKYMLRHWVDLVETIVETTVIPGDVTVDQIMKMFDAAKRAVGLINTIKNVELRRKHMTAVFINMNKIRGAMQKLMRQDLEKTHSGSQV